MAEKERITLENWGQTRKDLGDLREEKGKSPEALKAADAIEARVHEEVVDLIWEHYLIGKHMIMEAREKAGVVALPKKALEISRGYLIMRSSAKKAQEYIGKYNVISKRPRSGRFLGEVEMLVGNYKKAVEYFDRSAALFYLMPESSDRVNALELSGFLAEALILDGRTKEGIDIATKTFNDYDVGDGLELKNRDYYAWAVWKSGCAIKMWHALLHKNVALSAENRETLVQMLLEAEKVLNSSEDVEVKGDFAFREDEIALIKRKLKLD